MLVKERTQIKNTYACETTSKKIKKIKGEYDPLKKIFTIKKYKGKFKLKKCEKYGDHY